MWLFSFPNKHCAWLYAEDAQHCLKTLLSSEHIRRDIIMSLIYPQDTCFQIINCSLWRWNETLTTKWFSKNTFTTNYFWRAMSYFPTALLSQWERETLIRLISTNVFTKSPHSEIERIFGLSLLKHWIHYCIPSLSPTYTVHHVMKPNHCLSDIKVHCTYSYTSILLLLFTFYLLLLLGTMFGRKPLDNLSVSLISSTMCVRYHYFFYSRDRKSVV